jgi:tetratricopeptide (TPR) repeat protein
VAQAIEQSESWPSGDRTKALAFHYAESASPAKAVPYLIAAADSSARWCACETASEQYRQAMALLPDRPNGQSQEFFQVRLGLGRSLKFVGELAAAGELLSESLELLWHSDLAAESATLWPVLVEILRQLADIRQRQGSYDEALTYLETGLQVLGEASATENPGLWRLLIERQAWIHFRQGRLQQAFALADSAVQQLGAEEIDDPVMLAKLYNTLGGISWQQGKRERAADYVNHSLRLYERIGYLWGVGTAYGNLVLLYDVLGNWAKGIEYHQQAHAIQNDIGDIEGQARSLDNLGILHLIMGEHETAGQKMAASLALRQKLGDRFGIAQSQASLAELALIQSRFTEAQSHAESALTLADDIESPEIQVYARWILALVQAEQGHLETGLEFAQDALEMARTAGHVEGEADCLRVLGVLRSRTGQYDEAEAMLQDSVDLALKQDDPYRHGLALLELGRAYQSLAQIDQPSWLGWRAKAVVALNQAAEKFYTLGAAYQLQLAQTALSQLQSEGSEQA